MTTAKKLIAAAGAAGAGEGLYVEEVFSTYLYEGNGSTQTITNGIDLDGEGGLVWIKKRDAAYNHMLFDTERGPNKWIRSDTTHGEESGYTDLLDSFNSNGFTLDDDQSLGGVNYQLAGENQYASWTFRKAPKFFDVVTYTGDGTSNGSLKVPHNLGSAPGAIFIKRTDGTNDWFVTHRSTKGELYLNTTDAVQNSGTDRVTLGATELTFNTSSPTVNFSGAKYVAYLFAHDDSDESMIKCGSFTGNATVNVGFEPQWVMVKRTDNIGNWFIHDNMRGIATGGVDASLFANLTNTEDTSSDRIDLTATGFSANFGTGVETWIYMAIRRPNKPAEEFEPEELFAVDGERGGSGVEQYYYGYAGFPVDLALTHRKSGDDHITYNRLTSSALTTNSTAAESSVSDRFDNQEGYYYLSSGWTADSDRVTHMFRRAPGFFDVVAYTGDGVSGRTVSANLGVPAEMIWVKRRDAPGNFIVHHKDISSGQYLLLEASQAPGRYPFFGSQTADGLVLNNAAAGTLNGSGEEYVAYLFASVAGVSKVGSYTGTGAGNHQNIECGFSAGARFVLIKRTDTSGDWYVFDTERGINAGAVDPYLALNTTAAEASNFSIDPYAGGFRILQDGPTELNISGSTYIFLAIA